MGTPPPEPTPVTPSGPRPRTSGPGKMPQTKPPPTTCGLRVTSSVRANVTTTASTTASTRSSTPANTRTEATNTTRAQTPTPWTTTPTGVLLMTRNVVTTSLRPLRLTPKPPTVKPPSPTTPQPPRPPPTSSGATTTHLVGLTAGTRTSPRNWTPARPVTGTGVMPGTGLLMLTVTWLPVTPMLPATARSLVMLTASMEWQTTATVWPASRDTPLNLVLTLVLTRTLLRLITPNVPEPPPSPVCGTRAPRTV